MLKLYVLFLNVLHLTTRILGSEDLQPPNNVHLFLSSAMAVGPERVKQGMRPGDDSVPTVPCGWATCISFKRAGLVEA